MHWAQTLRAWDLLPWVGLDIKWTNAERFYTRQQIEKTFFCKWNQEKEKRVEQKGGVLV